MIDSKILLTGATGYIGSHTTIELLDAGFDVLLLDNFCNSSPQVVQRLQKISGKSMVFVKGDVRDTDFLRKVFQEHNITAVIHFAGLKAVGESIYKPLEYYENNVNGTLNLLQVMRETGVFNIVFSSSATVYGDPQEIPITENCPLGKPSNPYGQSKLMIENILEDVSFADARWSVANLRYFNPIGAHKSGLIGENPNGIPNNLMPYITQVAVGKLKKLSIFGSDYPTIDGTGVRDYIHVVDLAKGHLAALRFLNSRKGFHVWNLGTGTGYSVLQLVQTFEKVSGKKIPYEFTARRPGDVAEIWSNPAKAKKELSWQTAFVLEDMLQDSWRWQKNNPNGFEV